MIKKLMGQSKGRVKSSGTGTDAPSDPNMYLHSEDSGKETRKSEEKTYPLDKKPSRKRRMLGGYNEKQVERYNSSDLLRYNDSAERLGKNRTNDSGNVIRNKDQLSNNETSLVVDVNDLLNLLNQKNNRGPKENCSLNSAERTNTCVRIIYNKDQNNIISFLDEENDIPCTDIYVPRRPQKPVDPTEKCCTKCFNEILEEEKTRYIDHQKPRKQNVEEATEYRHDPRRTKVTNKDEKCCCNTPVLPERSSSHVYTKEAQNSGQRANIKNHQCYCDEDVKKGKTFCFKDEQNCLADSDESIHLIKCKSEYKSNDSSLSNVSIIIIEGNPKERKIDKKKNHVNREEGNGLKSCKDSSDVFCDTQEARSDGKPLLLKISLVSSSLDPEKCHEFNNELREKGVLFDDGKQTTTKDYHENTNRQNRKPKEECTDCRKIKLKDSECQTCQNYENKSPKTMKAVRKVSNKIEESDEDCGLCEMKTIGDVIAVRECDLHCKTTKKQNKKTVQIEKTRTCEVGSGSDTVKPAESCRNCHCTKQPAFNSNEGVKFFVCVDNELRNVSRVDMTNLRRCLCNQKKVETKDTETSPNSSSKSLVKQQPKATDKSKKRRNNH